MSLKMENDGKYCGEYAKIGICEKCGRQYLKVIFCGKDWCENCRKMTHNRRIARWLPKAMTMQSFGYFVFTIPEEMREFYQEKKYLSELRTYLRRRLKKIYPGIRALTRFHWFGDKDLRKFHPHFNIMIENFEKLPKKELERIKQDYKEALERFTGVGIKKTVTNSKTKIDVYYHYYSQEGFKKQYLRKHQKLTDQQAEKIYKKSLFDMVKYIARPTFLVYNRGLAGKLKGFRNSSNWGKFPELSYEDYEDQAKKRELFCDVSKELILLESGSCPHCAGDIRWFKELSSGALSFYGEEIGNGYYHLPVKIRSSPKLKLPNREQLKEYRHYRLFLYEQAMDKIRNWQERKDIYG